MKAEKEVYVVGLKTVGQNVWIYTYSNGNVWTWADGMNPQIRLYQYDGSYLKEQYNVSSGGSDGSWWDGWERDLRNLGFDVPNNLWENPQLIGENNFEIILYGESTTIVNKDKMYKDMNAINNAQQYMLEHAVAQGSLSRKESKVVSLMKLTCKFSEDNLNAYEKENVKLIKSMKK